MGDIRPQCTATTKHGLRCQTPVSHGQSLCPSHLRLERHRLAREAAMADDKAALHRAATELLNALDASSPSVRGGAITAYFAGIDDPTDERAEVWQALQRLGKCVAWVPAKQEPVHVAEEAPQVAESSRRDVWAPEQPIEEG